MTPEDQAALDAAQADLEAKRRQIAPPAPKEPIAPGFGLLGEDGFPRSQADWDEWSCHGCQDPMRAPTTPKRSEFGSAQDYIRAKACSGCAPGLLSKHLPRAEILSLAGVPRFERSQKWDLEKAQVNGSLPVDDRRCGTLEGWPENGKLSVVLVGKNGVGKTMLATELLVKAYRSGVRSLAWFTASELVAEHFDLESWERKTKAIRASRCGCLVLDEYGRGQHSSEFAYGLIGAVLDARKHGLTIITSNLGFASSGDGKSFEETDSAVFDRLTEGLLIHITGDSMRGRQ